MVPVRPCLFGSNNAVFLNRLNLPHYMHHTSTLSSPTQFKNTFPTRRRRSNNQRPATNDQQPTTQPHSHEPTAERQVVKGRAALSFWLQVESIFDLDPATTSPLTPVAERLFEVRERWHRVKAGGCFQWVAGLLGGFVFDFCYNEPTT